jgi:pentatricopeptide repeat protein
MRIPISFVIFAVWLKDVATVPCTSAFVTWPLSAVGAAPTRSKRSFVLCSTDKPAEPTPPTRKKKYAKSAKPPTSLNNELHRLRMRRNGVPLAERRLAEAVDYMIYQQENFGNVTSLFESPRPFPQKKRSTGLIFPDEISFNSIISSYAKNAHRDSMAPQYAEALLRRMQALSTNFPHLQPSIFTYNCVMEAFAKSASSTHQPRRSQQHKHQQVLLRLFQEVEDNLAPTTYTYNLILSLQSPLTRAWQRAEEWADGFIRERAPADDNIPDRMTFTHLLSTYAKVGDADKAERLLKDILQRQAKQHPQESNSEDNRKQSLQPNKVWFHCVLKAMALSSSLPDADTHLAGIKGDSLFQEMKSLYEAGDKGLRPDTTTYNHILNVHAQCGNTHRAEQLLLELEGAYVASLGDRVTYTTAIRAYATKQKKEDTPQTMVTAIAENATVIFQRMQDLSDTGRPNVSPSEVTFNTMISIWAALGTREGLHKATEFLRVMQDQRVLPDSVSFVSLIHGWSKANRQQGRLPEAGYRAEQLLFELEQLPPSRVIKGFSRTKVYNSVMTSWAKSGDKAAPARVDSLYSMLERKFLNGQMDACPDKTTFLCMMDAYAKAGVVNAEERCDALLTRMGHLKEVFQIGGLDPDRALFNSFLNALAKSCQHSAMEKAEEILTMMQTSQDDDLRPDIVTYSTVIDCYTKCGDGSHRADELRRFVEGSYRNGDDLLKPNSVFYSAILQAWAKTATPQGAEKAEGLLRRNLGLYEKGYDYAKPHGIMYNAGNFCFTMVVWWMLLCLPLFLLNCVSCVSRVCCSDGCNRPNRCLRFWTPCRGVAR